MPETTDIANLVINKLTKSQFTQAVADGLISESDISFITDMDNSKVATATLSASATQYFTFETSEAHLPGWLSVIATNGNGDVLYNKELRFCACADSYIDYISDGNDLTVRLSVGDTTGKHWVTVINNGSSEITITVILTCVGVVSDLTAQASLSETATSYSVHLPLPEIPDATKDYMFQYNATSGQVSAIQARVVVEAQLPTAENNYTWYRKYSDGWVEQGGETSASANSVTLPVEMADTHYTAIRTQIDTDIQSYYPAWVAGVNARTTTGFTFSVAGVSSIWMVAGMMATSDMATSDSSSSHHAG